MGNSAGGAICGQDLWLIVSGVNSAVPLFNPATKLYGGSNVFAAVDIYDNPNGPTFTVGLGSIPTITTFTNPVPLPAGIRLFGTALAGLGALKLKRRRRQALSAA